MADSAETKVPKGKKSRKGLLLVVIALVIVLVGGGGAAGFVLLRPKPAGTAGAKAEAGAGEGEASNKEPAVAEPGVLSLESFIANLADPEGDRYIKCTMRIQLDHREVAEKLKTDELAITKIRDRILTLLTSKSFVQITSTEGKQLLRGEIKEQLEPLLLGGKVDGVFFTEFIVQ